MNKGTEVAPCRRVKGTVGVGSREPPGTREMAAFFRTPARCYHLDPGLRNVLKAGNAFSLWPYSSLEHNGLCLKGLEVSDSLRQPRNQQLLGAALNRPSPRVFLVTFNLAR